MAIEVRDIEFIKKQYFSCAPINKLRFRVSSDSPEEAFDHETQTKILENTIEDSDSIKYPSRLSYRVAFLRALINKCGDEVNDKLYEILTSYMVLNDDTSPMHYLQFFVPQQDTRIILQESKSLISQATTGLRTWQAGFALAEWCCLNRSQISDKLVLELGSGVGLTGLFVVTSCAPKRYVFSDCHSGVLDMLVKNVRLNFDKDGEEPKLKASRTVEWNEESYRMHYRNTDVRVMRLDWGSIGESDDNESWARPEVVLAADVIYDEDLFDALVETLAVFLKRTKALVIVAVTVRNTETISKFFEKLDRYGLSFEEESVPKPFIFLQYDDTPVKILKIFNKN